MYLRALPRLGFLVEKECLTSIPRRAPRRWNSSVQSQSMEISQWLRPFIHLTIDLHKKSHMASGIHRAQEYNPSDSNSSASIILFHHVFYHFRAMND